MTQPTQVGREAGGIAYSDSSDAGRSILGAVLLDNKSVRTKFSGLNADHFLDEFQRRSWCGILKLSADGEPINPETLTSTIAVNGDRAPTLAKLYDIEAGAVSCGKATIERLKRLYLKKQLDAMSDLVSARVAAGDDPIEIADDAERKLSELRDTPTQETSPSRPDMPDSVLDGRLGEICQRRLSGLPLAYTWGAIATTAGVMLDRRDAQIRTNLYWAMVGPPGSGKSVTHEYAARVLGMENDPRIMQDAKYGSAEGLALALTEVEPNAVRLISPDELGHLLTKAAIDRSSFPSVLNSAFYRDRQQGGTKAKLFNIDCRLSIIGGLTIDMFPDCFGSATVGGLHSRFLFGLCPEPHKYSYRPFSGKAEAVSPFHLSVHDEIWDVSNHWIESEGIDPRVAENALRIAYICAAFDGRHELHPTDLGPTLAFAEYQMRARIVLAPNEGQNDDAKCAVAIRNWLQARKVGEWVSRRELDRGTHAGRCYGPTLFNRTLRNLAFNHEIELSQDGKRIRLVQSW